MSTKTTDVTARWHCAMDDFEGDLCQKGTPLISVCPICGRRDLTVVVDKQTVGICLEHFLRWQCGHTPLDCSPVNDATPFVNPKAREAFSCVEPHIGPLQREAEGA